MAGDIKSKYIASGAYTITLNSLANSSLLTMGRESTAIDNTTTLALDYLCGGKIKAGTSPTGGAATLYVYGNINDTPLYPDLGAGTTLTGSDNAATWSSISTLNGGVESLNVVTMETTTGRVSAFKPRSVASCFGGQMPALHGLYFSQSSGVALDASAGGGFWYKPVLAQYT